MIIWKPLVGEFLQYVKESTNEVCKNVVAVLRTNCVLDIFATGKHVNHGGEYGLEIPANFHFYGPEKVINLFLANVPIL